jgi:HSP20 family molecular chaperone IbpA
VGDVTDCLSAAYECVSRLIGEKPLRGEVQERQGVEDCRKAEDRWMPWLMVDLGESEQFVYALASVPGYAGKDLSIGLEAGWLAILAQRENGDPVQTFCVMSLPAEVNPVHSIAVLAKGVLGIRMPKLRA